MLCIMVALLICNSGNEGNVKQNSDSGNFKVNIGAPSIILLLVVFALTIFALLSIRASYNELGLAKTSLEAAQRYYEAEGRAETVRARLDEAYLTAKAEKKDLSETALSIPEVVGVCEDGTVIASVDITDSSRIDMELVIKDGSAKVQKHQYVTDRLEGYDASGFEILDPIWIELDDENYDTDEALWAEDEPDLTEEDSDYEYNEDALDLGGDEP